MNEIEIANELAALIEQQMNGIDNSENLRRLKRRAEKQSPVLYKLAYDKAVMKSVSSNVSMLTDKIDTPDHIEAIRNSLNDTKYGVIVVSGDSMIEAGIDDGDYCIIDKTGNPGLYETVIAEYKGKRFIKKYQNTSDKIILISANSNYPNIEINDMECFNLIGVVVSVLKNT